MKKYENGRLIKVVCNQCGREIKTEADMIKECICSVDTYWGYFSGKDGDRHQFDLCEECYDLLVGRFCIPVEISQQTELL